MKNMSNNTQRKFRTGHATIVLLLALLLSACAPPPSAGPGLSNELKLLKQQQLQQQQTLEFIQQQLAQLSVQMGDQIPVAAESEPEPPTTSAAIESQAEAPLQPVAEDVESLVASASSYLEAFSALAMGRYQSARDGFSAFLQNFSDHRYAPNARYWLAEAEIALGQPQQAEKNLMMIVNDSINERKAPAALFRLAQLYQQQNQTEQAEDILHQLRTRFPESREAQQSNRSDQTQ